MSRRGFTFIEILLVLSLIGILSTFGFAAFNGVEDRLQLQKVCRELSDDLRIARRMALFRKTEHTVSFMAPRGYALPWSTKQLPPSVRFGYPPGVEGPPSDPHPLSDPDGVSFIGNRIVFSPAGHNSLGTLYLTGDSGETRAITVTLVGRVRIWEWRNGQWR
jgi:prepilin-type N-terminal cleavage/methylation domain-containing protein